LAGWNAGEYMVDGPGSVGFHATAILFAVWCADGCTALIAPKHRLRGRTPRIRLHLRSGHGRGFL
jgi:hypothetical protein